MAKRKIKCKYILKAFNFSTKNLFQPRCVISNFCALIFSFTKKIRTIEKFLHKNYNVQMSKFILVTSGVCSSLGKGLACASLASLLESSGLTISIVKCDPYINLDAGNISPFQHGEVFVCEDGTETDLDLGSFSRFTNVHLTEANCMTIGKVYYKVIQNERAGKYNGRTVQVIPHITDEIKRNFFSVAEKTKSDIVIIEIGGTVGDIESIPYLEASRQMIQELPPNDVCSIHLTLIPEITGGELKTKPTQHSSRQLQEAGIQPDVLLCRVTNTIEESMRKKIALFCNVSPDAVFSSIDVEHSVYELPIIFHKESLDAFVLKKLKLSERKCSARAWKSFIEKLNTPEKSCTIAIVGKTDTNATSCKSVEESLLHAAVTACHAKVELKKLDAETLEKIKSDKEFANLFKNVSGIVIPQSYGQRGFLGLLRTVQFAREKNIPYFGIDLGMHLMAIETARSLLEWKDADSTEFVQNTTHAIVSLPEEQQHSLLTTSAPRFGDAEVTIEKSSRLFSIYKKTLITERMRNRYFFDSAFLSDMKKNNLVATSFSHQGNHVESFEWENHPWGIGVQFHPEFISKPAKPHPLFVSFVECCLENTK